MMTRTIVLLPFMPNIVLQLQIVDFKGSLSDNEPSNMIVFPTACISYFLESLASKTMILEL
jgi:hypothetical protein